MIEKNLYKILQVDPEAEPDVIVAAYRALAAKLHPDRDVTGVDEFRMKELNRAMSVLRDPERRRTYDQELAASSMTPMGPGAAGGTGPARSGASHLADRMQSYGSEGLSDTRLDFGRYEGWRLGDLLRHDPDYLRWLSRHSSGIRYRRTILKLLAESEARSPTRTPFK